MKVLALLCALFVQQEDSKIKFPKSPWELDFKIITKPTLFAHGKDHYWYVVYEVTNRPPLQTPQSPISKNSVTTQAKVPNIFDVSLFLEIGRDYTDNREKLDVEKYKRLYNEKEIVKRPYEFERFGVYYSNLYIPDVETEIVGIDARINNRNKFIIEESIQKMRNEEKNGYRCRTHLTYFSESNGICKICEAPLERIYLKGMYLGPRQLREIKYIEPDQTLHCIAIFYAADLGAQMLDLQISGLKSLVELKEITQTGIIAEDKNKCLHYIYEFPGSPTERLGDMVTFIHKKLDVKRVGPCATKDQMTELMQILVKAYQNEIKWAEQGIKGEELEKNRIAESTTERDVRIAFRIFTYALGMNFGMTEKDWDNGILANKEKFYKMQEWWIKNEAKLKLNRDLNRYVLSE